jgi:hypothetical protein
MAGHDTPPAAATFLAEVAVVLTTARRPGDDRAASRWHEACRADATAA